MISKHDFILRKRRRLGRVCFPPLRVWVCPALHVAAHKSCLLDMILTSPAMQNGQALRGPNK